VGIARDALRAGHRGPVRLIHGAPTRDALYLHDELRALAARHPTFTYEPAVLDTQGDARLAPIRLEVALVEAVRRARDARVFLCGSPGTVDRLSREATLAGAHPDELHSTVFPV
jgi:ferredoxin-NADP reductase